MDKLKKKKKRESHSSFFHTISEHTLVSAGIIVSLRLLINNMRPIYLERTTM